MPNDASRSDVPEESLAEVKRHLAPQDLVPEQDSKTRDVGTMARQVDNLRPAQTRKTLLAPYRIL
jgi:hypothetical protein